MAKPRANDGRIFKKRAATDEPPIIDMKVVSKTYHETDVPVRALSEASLNVKRGEMVAIMGPSGSGKTTLLNILGMLDTPDSGSVVFAGQDLADLKRRQLPRFRQKEIGHIFQQKNLIPTLTAVENVYLPFRYTKGRRSQKLQQANEALRLVGMVDRAKHRPSKLSGGEQQRVAIARALVLSPSLVLADEPTGELDSKTGRAIIELMQELNAQTNQTFIIVTHNDMVASASHRVLNMQDGKIVESAKRRKKN